MICFLLKADVMSATLSYFLPFHGCFIYFWCLFYRFIFFRTKTKKPKEENYKQMDKRKKRYLCSLGLTSLLILKVLGSFSASRLKRAGSLFHRKWSENQSWQKDEKSMEIKYQKRKKNHGGVEWYLSLIFSKRSSTVRSLLHSYKGFFNFSDFDFWDQKNVGRSEKIKNAKRIK